MTETSRGVRLTALALFVLLPLGLAGWGVANALEWQGTEELITQQERLLAQLDARLAKMSKDGKVALDTSAIYLAANSKPLASADLQQRLVHAIDTVGGKVVEAQEVEDVDTTEPDAVRLRVTLDVVNAGLLDLLYDLETGIPLMAVDSITIRQVGAKQDEPVDDPTLRVDLVIRAYWKAAA